MKFAMTGQEKYDLLIQVTAWAGVYVNKIKTESFIIVNYLSFC